MKIHGVVAWRRASFRCFPHLLPLARSTIDETTCHSGGLLRGRNCKTVTTLLHVSRGYDADTRGDRTVPEYQYEDYQTSSYQVSQLDDQRSLSSLPSFLQTLFLPFPMQHPPHPASAERGAAGRASGKLASYFAVVTGANSAIHASTSARIRAFVTYGRS